MNKIKGLEVKEINGRNIKIVECERGKYLGKKMRLYTIRKDGVFVGKLIDEDGNISKKTVHFGKLTVNEEVRKVFKIESKREKSLVDKMLEEFEKEDSEVKNKKLVKV